MRTDLDIDFYDWLRTQFHDLETAKEFGRRWVDADCMNQETPYGLCSMRSMAYHCSQALEGKLYAGEPPGPTDYASTTHGVAIVNAIWWR